MTAPSERFLWLEKVREHQARKQRIAALRRELAACREAGKRIRHQQRLRRERAGDTTSKETSK